METERRRSEIARPLLEGEGEVAAERREVRSCSKGGNGGWKRGLSLSDEAESRSWGVDWARVNAVVNSLLVAHLCLLLIVYLQLQLPLRGAGHCT